MSKQKKRVKLGKGQPCDYVRWLWDEAIKYEKDKGIYEDVIHYDLNVPGGREIRVFFKDGTVSRFYEKETLFGAKICVMEPIDSEEVYEEPRTRINAYYWTRLYEEARRRGGVSEED